MISADINIQGLNQDLTTHTKMKDDLIEMDLTNSLLILLLQDDLLRVPRYGWYTCKYPTHIHIFVRCNELVKQKCNVIINMLSWEIHVSFWRQSTSLNWKSLFFDVRHIVIMDSMFSDMMVLIKDVSNANGNFPLWRNQWYNSK